MAGRIRWLVTFFLRAEPRGAAPRGWAVVFDVIVAVGAAAGAVRQTAKHVVAGWAVVDGSAPGRLVYHGIAGQVPLHGHASFVVLAAAAMTGLPLAFRRYYPISVWLVIAAAIAFVSAAGAVSPVALGAVVYATYSAIVHSRYRNLAIAIVAVFALTVAFATDRLDNELPKFPVWLTPVLVVLLVAGAGFGIRELRRRLADSAAKLRRAGAEARAATEAALAAERSRIAAELHDVVTHNVSVMIVQAGAARKILSSSPLDAEESLLAAEASGREAMAELRNLLGLLSPPANGSGGGAGPAALTPQPGLDDLDTLIGRVSAAGLAAGLRVTGEPRPLPPGADLAAYRVVQEGLTNVLRHAGQATATVAVDWGDDLVITVTDDGGREPGDASAGRADGTPGRGLLGLRERLALYGATLAAGPQPGGGWLLRAVMPAPERGTP